MYQNQTAPELSRKLFWKFFLKNIYTTFRNEIRAQGFIYEK